MVVTTLAESAVILPQGKIDITNAHELHKQLTDLHASGIKEITIDLTNVTRIDCFGLGKLLIAQKMLRQSQGGLKLVNISSSSVSRFFSLVQLEKVIPLA